MFDGLNVKLYINGRLIGQEELGNDMKFLLISSILQLAQIQEWMTLVSTSWMARFPYSDFIMIR